MFQLRHRFWILFLIFLIETKLELTNLFSFGRVWKLGEKSLRFCLIVNSERKGNKLKSLIAVWKLRKYESKEFVFYFILFSLHGIFFMPNQTEVEFGIFVLNFLVLKPYLVWIVYLNNWLSFLHFGFLEISFCLLKLFCYYINFFFSFF